MPQPSLLLLPFLDTIIIEGLCVAALTARIHPVPRTLLVVLLLHCCTHPLGAVLYYFTSLPLLFAECMVTLLEGVGYRILLVRSWLIALGVSVAANLASFYIGPIIRTALKAWVT